LTSNFYYEIFFGFFVKFFAGMILPTWSRSQAKNFRSGSATLIKYTVKGISFCDSVSHDTGTVPTGGGSLL
jgi:hypothetical protein